jgi:ribosomal-protein-alanine N-acetyltransferase
MMMGWRIREMTRWDLPQVMDIETDSFPTAWTRGMFLYELNSPLSACFSAVTESDASDRLLGYIVFSMIKGEVHILNLATASSVRRRGIAHALLSYALEFAFQRGGIAYYLEVRATNVPALSLYKKVGFRPWARRKQYYGDTGEDAVVMRLFYGGRLHEERANEQADFY